MVGFLAVREKGKMEQVAFLDQPLVTSLLSHSKNYSLLETPNTASARLGQARPHHQLSLSIILESWEAIVEKILLKTTKNDCF